MSLDSMTSKIGVLTCQLVYYALWKVFICPQFPWQVLHQISRGLTLSWWFHQSF